MGARTLNYLLVFHLLTLQNFPYTLKESILVQQRTSVQQHIYLKNFLDFLINSGENWQQLQSIRVPVIEDFNAMKYLLGKIFQTGKEFMVFIHQPYRIYIIIQRVSSGCIKDSNTKRHLLVRVFRLSNTLRPESCTIFSHLSHLRCRISIIL